VCSFCDSFDHDVNSCPYYDVFDEAYARFNVVIEIMKEQHTHFVSEMRECGLLHEIDPSLPLPRLESSLYDDCKSSLSLESNVADDAPLADLDEVFGPPLTSLPFVAPSFSSIPMDTSFSNLTLLASSLPLVQCTGLEMDEISRGYASIIEDDSLGWSEEFTLDEPCLK